MEAGRENTYYAHYSHEKETLHFLRLLKEKGRQSCFNRFAFCLPSLREGGRGGFLAPRVGGGSRSGRR